MVNWQTMEDSQLIEACLAGEEAAWTALIQRYSRLIYTIPLRFGFPRVIADEVFQETCLVLLEGLEGLRDRQRISSWLMTVGRRACIQRIRQRQENDQPLEVIENKYQTPSLESELIWLEQQQLVHTALAKLAPRCQQLLKALFFTVPPPSYEEIARDLDTSVGNIGGTRIRCLKKLYQELVKIG